jgi:hypothetical protein
LKKKKKYLFGKYLKKSKWCHVWHSKTTMCEQTIGVHCSRKCSCKCSHRNSSLDTCIKTPYLYFIKKTVHLSFVTSIVNNLSFVARLIFSHNFFSSISEFANLFPKYLVMVYKLIGPLEITLSITSYNKIVPISLPSCAMKIQHRIQAYPFD